MENCCRYVLLIEEDIKNKVYPKHLSITINALETLY